MNRVLLGVFFVSVWLVVVVALYMAAGCSVDAPC